MNAIRRFWISMNYRYRKAEAYLAAQRGDGVAVADFESRASEWEREYMMLGRSLT